MKKIIVLPFLLLITIGFNWGNEIIFEPVPVDGVRTERFGWDVDIDGDIAVASWLTPNGSKGYGAFFVYQRDANGSGSWGLAQKVVNKQGKSADVFGTSIALSGENILVSTGKEAAFIYNQIVADDTTWNKAKTFVSPETGSNYGASVDLSGEYAIIGAPDTPSGNDTLTGVAYIYAQNEGDVNNWGELIALTVSDSNYTNYKIGSAVAMTANYAVVNGLSTNNSKPGVVFVFDRNAGGEDNWGLVATLVGDTEERDRFGSSVAIENDVIVVGAKLDNTFDSFAGAIYIFEKDAGGENNWGKVKVLGSSEVEAKQALGADVSISGDYILAGADRKSYNGSRYQAGAAFYFYRNEGGTNNWGEILRFSPSDGTPLDYFGNSVALDGDLAFIGAYGKSVAGTSGAGGAYLFGSLSIVSDEQAPQSPTNFKLNQNYPNPFNPTTTFSINLQFGSDVNVSIYNLAGQKVRTLSTGILPAGEHFFTWDSSNDAGTQMPSGVYFYRLKTGLFTETRQMILIK